MTLSTLQLYVSGILLALLLAGGGALTIYEHHQGYVEGQQERTSHYEPLLRQADQAKEAADARATQIERASQAAAKESQQKHAADQQVLQTRVDAANTRIAQLLRSVSQSLATAGSCQSLPPARGPGAVASGAGASGERVSGIAAALSNSLAATAGKCEHDAAEVAGWQRWYAEQQARLNVPSP